jgi:hypothetical protein
MVPALRLGLIWASLQPQLGLTRALPPDAHGLPALTAAQPRPPFRHARPALPPDVYCLCTLVHPPDAHVHLTPALALATATLGRRRREHSPAHYHGPCPHAAL